MNSTPLPIHCRLDDYTGYGQFSTELAVELYYLSLESKKRKSIGCSFVLSARTNSSFVDMSASYKHKKPFHVEVYPACVDFPYSTRPTELEQIVRNKTNKHSWELVIHAFIYGKPVLNPRKKTAYYTMWESTGLGVEGLLRLNSVSLIIVPNQWCASCFLAAGTTTPVAIVPLGIRLEDYPYADQSDDDRPFVFGVGAAFQHGGIRKGLDIVVNAFRIAFPKKKDVELWIKPSGREPFKTFFVDPRIKVTHKHLNLIEMSDWYKNINVYVSGSSCEGWGRHQQEAMATGRPVIGVNFGGITEFWNPTNGYEVEFQMTEGEGIYRGFGYYSLPSVESMAYQMRRAYEDRSLLREKGRLSYESAIQYPVRRSAKELLKVLRSYQYL